VIARSMRPERPARWRSVDERNTDEMADHAEPDAHAAPSLARGPSVDGVAGLAHITVAHQLKGWKIPMVTMAEVWHSKQMWP